ncbi:hypothetical protein [Fulvivirga lutea]|uniref:DUF1579 domain-containing protein n=1 Tax=Fulvivirga lutea TaxID=2810512 RepID=A0A974WFV1_9BACT|nr:hypothetical protein [Fulvivirga lutea]QSE97009.1 hypothetical protein JR347_15635 [Fulvivirga lutea]
MKKFNFLIVGLIFITCSQLVAQPFYSQDDVKNLPEAIDQYGRLVGVWDCKMENLQKDVWVKDSAMWDFRYILGGAAIQDFWYNPNEKTGKNYLGTNIRIYNTKTEKWECAWIENQSTSIAATWESYKNESGDMVLHDGSGKWEILFYNIKENSFDWKWDFKQEDGSMKTMMKMKAYRMK